MLYAAITNQNFSYLFKLEKRNGKYIWVNRALFKDPPIEKKMPPSIITLKEKNQKL